MLKNLVESISEWTWTTRIIFAAILISISAANYIYFERIWIWGYALAAFIILSGFLFQEKHIEYDEEKAEELVVNNYYLDWDALEDLMSFFPEIAIKGFSIEKYGTLIKQIDNMDLDQVKQFNYFLTTAKTSSSLLIKVQKESEKYRVLISSNNEISQMMKAFSVVKLGL